MDLSSMLNDGTAQEKRPPQASPQAPAPSTIGRVAAPQTSPPPQNGSYTTGYTQSRATPGQRTPLFGPPSSSIGAQSQSQSRGLTPLHTPSQAPGGGQYPFPPQHPPSQSPAASQPGQQHRSFEAYSAVPTPGARPSSHGYSTQPSPGPALGQHHHGLMSHHTSSSSPTPSSHHSGTPHSVRQSPLTTMNHPTGHQHAPPHHYHHSQPTTPLGPPQLPQRHSNQQLDLSSPYHQRTYSSASNGMAAAASPAHHTSSLGNIADSPGAMNRPSPSRRPMSDYRGSVDRERSVSVSPKTMVPPRPPSLDSRHSSQQDVHSARSSLQLSGRVASYPEVPGHVKQPMLAHAKTYPGGDVPQEHSRASSGPPINGTSLSPADSKTPIQHQPQKMLMSHLLAPTQHSQPQHLLQNQASSHTTPSKSHDSTQSPLTMPSAAAASLASFTGSHQHQSQALRTHDLPLSATSSIPSESSAPMTSAQVKSPSVLREDGMELKPSESRPSKRPADFETSIEPAAKRGRRRKYTARPPWAQLSSKNPRYGQPGIAPNAPAQAQRTPQNQPQNRAQQSQPNGGATVPAQGSQQDATLPDSDNISEKPWLQRPPIDNDLVNARNVLGGWEKSFKWDVPIPPMTKAVMDWLYQNLEANSDVGTDAREGSIEIEAKIGTLIDKNTGQRCSLPVENAVVISTRENKRYNFDSQMNESEHKNMNKFLNEAVKKSRAERGREPMMYEHIRETDSFRLLSDTGIKALPPAAHKRPFQRDLKLRTSVQDQSGQVSARIVKIPIGDNLHIFGAQEPYDVRISMNLEINLDRPELDAHAVVEEPTVDRPPPPNRHKDRLSYRHLAYHVDLTRVDVKGMPPKYELELEVDAPMLRQQIELAKRQHKNAYIDMVEGFVTNMLWLMKQQR